MFDPIPPPYDVATWRTRPFHERMREICVAWATHGYGVPPGIYLLYVFKIMVLYVGGWCFFCSFTPGLGNPFALASWGFDPVAFQKAVLWTLAYEGLGFGCASGPLTGRYIPPVGGFLHFLRPGTTKLSTVPGLPILGGTRRTPLDALLYAAHYVFLFRALVAPEITPDLLYPTVVLLLVLGLSDQTIYLSARAEHHFTALLCFLFVPLWIAGCKIVWLAIWMWAATSKLNHHFPGVVSVMLSNSPLVPVSIRKKLFRSYPDDLRPARRTATIAHMGTLVELTFPLVLLAGDGGPITWITLFVMFGFHCFIAGNMPMGMPVEWNVIMVYGGFFLFGFQADVSVLPLASEPLLLAILVLVLFVTPLYGNFVPSRVSFLLSMRYYAGNWAYSIWLFRGDSVKKLGALTKAAQPIRDQLERIMPEPEQVDSSLAGVPAFRHMHLHGRVLHDLVPKAIDCYDDYEAYEWIEGEVVAGLALGWNFGDGHLHDEKLLAAIQEQCGFEEGELRCIMVESQPIHRQHHAWRVVDAATGLIEEGTTPVATLLERQPWPTEETLRAARP